MMALYSSYTTVIFQLLQLFIVCLLDIKMQIVKSDKPQSPKDFPMSECQHNPCRFLYSLAAVICVFIIIEFIDDAFW